MSDHPDGCRCATCGGLASRLDWGFQRPDDVWAQPPDERSPRNTNDFCDLGERRFTRGLLPVPIEGGDEFL